MKITISLALLNIYDSFIQINETTICIKLIFLAVFPGVVTTSCFKLTTFHIVTANMLKGLKLKDFCKHGNQQKC